MGVYLSTAKTEKASEDGEDDRLRFGVSSMQGWRSTMEDAHAAVLDLDDSTSFFGVYDGHGGKAVAKFCAKYLHQQLLKQEAYLAGDLRTSLRKAFLRMDEMMCGQKGWRELAILGDKLDQFNGMIEGLLWSKNSEVREGDREDWPSEKSQDHGVVDILLPSIQSETYNDIHYREEVIKLYQNCDAGLHSDYPGPKCGSTACVAIIRNNLLVVANAGDSRCVISRNGQAYNMSKDHKPDLDAEKERIIKAGGYIQFGRVNGTLNLARAIGDVELKMDNSLPAEEKILTANPDIRTVDLDDEDEFIAIACDGVWDCMSSQQLVDFVREQMKSESKLSVVIEKVFDRCLAPSPGGVGCDNMTMILVQFKKSSYFKACGEKQQPLPSDQQSEAVCSPSKS